MFGLKRRRRERALAIQAFEERKQAALSCAQGAVSSLPGIASIEIAERSCPDRMGVGAPLIHVATWCLVVHATHLHHAGAAIAALPDRMHDFPVRVESPEQPSSRLTTALGAFMGLVNSRN